MSNGASGDLTHDEKVRLEERKLQLERQKIIATAATVGVSVLIPLVIAAVGVWQGLQAIKEQAKYDFQLKAAEIVMDTSNASATANRARALRVLFPQSLSSTFAQGFNASDFGQINEIPSKKELIHLIAEHPEKRGEIIEMWEQLFPGDQWVNEIKNYAVIGIGG